MTQLDGTHGSNAPTIDTDQIREDQLERANSERRYAAKLLLSAAWRHTRPDSA